MLDTKKAFQEGLKEGEKRSYKVMGIIGAFFDEQKKDYIIPCNYNKNQEKAWKKGFIIGKWRGMF